MDFALNNCEKQLSKILTSITLLPMRIDIRILLSENNDISSMKMFICVILAVLFSSRLVQSLVLMLLRIIMWLLATAVCFNAEVSLRREHLWKLRIFLDTERFKGIAICHLRNVHRLVIIIALRVECKRYV